MYCEPTTPVKKYVATLRVLTQKQYPILIFYLPVSLAKHFHSPEDAWDFRTQEAHYSLKWNVYYKEKRPFGFILENVEGLVIHDCLVMDKVDTKIHKRCHQNNRD